MRLKQRRIVVFERGYKTPPLPAPRQKVLTVQGYPTEEARKHAPLPRGHTPFWLQNQNGVRQRSSTGFHAVTLVPQH